MDPRVLFLVIIFVGFGTFINVVITNPTAASKRISSDIVKLLQDCKLSNSVTFTECLRRLKRHHIIDDIDHNCMELCVAECIKKKRGDCEVSCQHCMLIPAKYTRRVISMSEALYGLECSSGNCTKVAEKKGTPVVVNVTNHIHVHNHYNTSSTPTGTSSKIINDNPQDCPCYFITWIPCYCRPKYSICQYPYQWPCNPYGGFGRITPEVEPCIVVRPNNPNGTTTTTIPTISTIPTVPTISTTPTMSATPTVSATPTIST
ncbi:uncharacterized protein LOC143358108 [Halictus rubicundus]|uniref:uncharacterized protein LOC143358108 n=1 Tax=Halictus rubicundus TaxID=77578 RepID=UPI004036795C